MCPSQICMEVALRRRALANALGGPARLRVLAPDASALWLEVVAEVEREVECLRSSSVPPRSFPVRLPALLTLQRRLCEQGEGA